MRVAVCKTRLIGLLLGVIATINRNTEPKCLYFLSFYTGYETLAARQHLVISAQETTTFLVPVRMPVRESVSQNSAGPDYDPDVL